MKILILEVYYMVLVDLNFLYHLDLILKLEIMYLVNLDLFRHLLEVRITL